MAKKSTNPPAMSGGMNLKDFSPQQNQALLDLLVLAMYMDGYLAKVEEARVQSLLNAMGFDSDYDRNRQFDESVTRIRRQAQSPDATKTLTASLAANFKTEEQRQRIYDMLKDLAAVDGRVSPEESKFLGCVKEAFKI